jgi:endonuclease/exonuclease/phosphatase family metal-dependent hydrolase
MVARQLSRRGLLRFAQPGMAIVLLLGASLASAGASQAESPLSVLSYNVHGLSPLIAKDKPRRRLKTIGPLATAYDVVLFQEDFDYHAVISKRMEGSVGVRGNGMTFDPRRLAAKILLAPLSLFLPHFSAPYGAGLSTFVKSALLRPGDVGREPFGVCDGWLGARLDCWASKGYLRVGIRTREGVLVDVYSTHLDAGKGTRAIKTRRRQLRVLASAIEKQSEDRAIIVGGDFNLAFDRPGDGEVMVEFRERLSLHDSGARPELPFWRDRDYILYRSGTQAQISVEQAGEAVEFVDGRQALSDHPAVYARFRVRASSADAAEDPGECRPMLQRPHEPTTLMQ